ncbi:MAG: LexA family transcriptional regulator [Shewanella sp.]|nr:LexA family transcriptional regulator [Shewanella sp.]
MDIKQIIGQRLRQCRHELNWTAEDAAKRLSKPVLPSRYSNWELGLRAPKPEQIFDLANLYKKSPAWVAGYSDIESTPADSLNFVSVSQATISVKDTLLVLERVSNDSAFNRDYIRRRGLNENKLTSIIAPDDSMCGRNALIKEGDELLIDRSQTTVTKADLFAMLVNDQIWIRWIRPEITGGFTVATEDPAHYPDTSLSAAELASQKIIGRVTRISRDR